MCPNPPCGQLPSRREQATALSSPPGQLHAAGPLLHSRAFAIAAPRHTHLCASTHDHARLATPALARGARARVGPAKRDLGWSPRPGERENVFVSRSSRGTEARAELRQWFVASAVACVLEPAAHLSAIATGHACRENAPAATAVAAPPAAARPAAVAAAAARAAGRRAGAPRTPAACHLRPWLHSLPMPCFPPRRAAAA